MSFSSEIKQELAGAVPKSQCCRRAAADGIWKFAELSGRVGKLCFSDGGDISAFVISVTETGYGRERCIITKKGEKRIEMRGKFSFDLISLMLLTKSVPPVPRRFLRERFSPTAG